MVVGARTEAAEGRDCSDYQSGKALAQCAAFHPAGGAIRRRHVMDQNVGAGQERIERRTVARLLQVECDAELVGVEVQEQAALVGVGDVVGKWSAAAGYVTLGR